MSKIPLPEAQKTGEGALRKIDASLALIRMLIAIVSAGLFSLIGWVYTQGMSLVPTLAIIILLIVDILLLLGYYSMLKSYDI